ncbi:phenylacetic acid degradation protein PaaD, thioesterase [Klebsiella pneumoniae subsp. rhinoscleromatis]|nr:phenylacetic acid degradation protein PaaD, thioesterase [Klebsiella pneumoniae subsp. rhinoscleromatis]
MSNDPWRNARVMYEKDTCARKMGIELIEIDERFCADEYDRLGGHA